MNEITQVIILLYMLSIISLLILKKYKNILYILEWIIPSSTGVYIYLNQYYGMEMISAYFIACTVGMIIYLPINKFIFKNKCEPITIYVNGVELKVKDKSYVDATSCEYKVIDR